MTFTMAIVGRPNVGKSTLFNRLVGRRVAIVHDQPGITRDIVSAEVGRGDYMLLATGGIGIVPEMTPEAIHAATEEQVDFAVQAARAVIFVCDGHEGLTALEAEIGGRLRRYGKAVVLVVNKVDNERLAGRVADFYELGFGEPVALSAEHNRNVEALEERIRGILGPPPEPSGRPAPQQERIRICFAGRPNVGKSSLCNRLLDSRRMIVSDVPGTTRDAVSVDLDFEAGPGAEPWRFRLFDTAGVRARTKVSSSVEYFSGLRTRDAIEGSDVSFLVLDAREGVTRQDKKLAGDILEAGSGLVVLVNKWDYARETFKREPLPGYESLDDFRKAFIKALRKELFFMPDSPVVFCSAKEGLAIADMLQTAREVHAMARRQLPTGQLNRLIHELLEANPPRLIQRRRFKAYYTVQTGTAPLRIRVFCNAAERLDESYERYLANGVLKAFGLKGTPLRLQLVGKPRERERA